METNGSDSKSRKKQKEEGQQDIGLEKGGDEEQRKEKAN